MLVRGDLGKWENLEWGRWPEFGNERFYRIYMSCNLHRKMNRSRMQVLEIHTAICRAFDIDNQSAIMANPHHSKYKIFGKLKEN
jgi:hypothetical protein